MDERPNPEEVTRGLKTTSAKIRALAQANYPRVDISRHLGLSYQHVRNVLVGSGLTEAPRVQVEAMREPVAVDATPPSPPEASIETLLEGGFQVLGEWVLEQESGMRLNAQAPIEPGVYSFAVEDLVTYVGLTNNGLRGRFEQYRRGHESQTTNARVKRSIVEALSQGLSVKVLFAIPEPQEWKGLPVNTAAGLEAALIQMLRPPWNILGSK